MRRLVKSEPKSSPRKFPQEKYSGLGLIGCSYDVLVERMAAVKRDVQILWCGVEVQPLSEMFRSLFAHRQLEDSGHGLQAQSSIKMVQVPSVEELGYHAKIILQWCFICLEGMVFSPQGGIICMGVLHAVSCWHVRDVDVEQYGARTEPCGTPLRSLVLYTYILLKLVASWPHFLRDGYDP